MKTFKSNQTVYLEYAHRGTETLAFNLKADGFANQKNLVLRFVVTSSDGQYQGFQHLSIRESADFNVGTGKVKGFRLDKLEIPVVEKEIPLPFFVEFCRKEGILFELLTFITDTAHAEGFVIEEEFLSMEAVDELIKLLEKQFESYLPKNLNKIYHTPVLTKAKESKPFTHSEIKPPSKKVLDEGDLYDEAY